MEREIFYIAGHRFVLVGRDVVSLLHGVPGYEYFSEPASTGSSPQRQMSSLSCPLASSSDWQVTFQPQPLACEGELLYSYYFADIATDSYFRRSAEGAYSYEMTSRRGKCASLCLQYRPGESAVLASLQGIRDMRSGRANPPPPLQAMLHFGLWVSFALLAAQAATVPVHSSAVVWHEQAVMFLGESGTGKSTHARLWQQNVEDSWLLNDDSPIVSLSESFPVVFGSPWSGKTPCYHSQGFPLGAIVRLSQAPQNTIQRLSVPAAVAAVQPSCPTILAYDARYADWIQDCVSAIVSTVPVYHLSCLPDAAAAQLCFGSLREDLQGRRS